MLTTMKTGTKILASYAVAIALLVGLGIVSYLGLEQVVGTSILIAEARYPSASAVAKIHEAQTDVQRVLNALINRRFDPAARRELFAQLEEAYQHIDEGAKEWKGLPHTEKGQEHWKASWSLLETWRKAAEATAESQKERSRLLEAGAGNEDPRVAALDARSFEALKQARESYKPAAAAVRETYKYVDKVVDEESKHAEAIGAQAETVLVAVVLAAALTLIVLGVLLSRVIGKAIHGAAAEAARLAAAVAEGKLDVRGDAEKVHFEFRPIVEGMNGTMDAFAKPLAQSRDYMERISRGDVPAPIAETYKGDFDRTKQALNRCIEAFKALVADGRALAKGAAAGELSARADASRHQGDFRRIIEGFNATLDTILAPVEESRRALERLAQRDLTARVKGDYQGDHARLKDALNATAEALHGAIAQVADAVEQVSAASGQIASSSQAVASGASEQASSLEETNSSLESITTETRQAAVNASEASDLTGVARSSAQEGAKAMGQMQGTMGKIRQSAEGTSGIIKDISEIAFQTNLLALNAAVEAARAGEAGRGFAVVAEEVRSLALRAKEAAAKTEELIKESVKQAGEGEVASKQVAEKLGEIVEGISEVSDITTAIAFTAKEQAGRIEQVNRAVGEMGKVTQQNAASSEESSSAAEELSSQSEELAAMVGSFKIERSGVLKGAAAPVRRAPAALVKPKRANTGGGALLASPEDIVPLEGETFKEF